LGDCFWVSAINVLAQNHPEVLQRAIKPAGDNRYTVTLYESGPKGSAPKPVALTVDLSVPSKSGQPLYMSARTPNELWPLVLEKAYAEWKGSFEDIVGGMSANAFEALTGKPAAYFPVTNDMVPSAVFKQVAKASSGGASAVALSKPFGSGMLGMVADHAYAALGTSERDGKQWIQLRNPWGEKEPGRDGRNDGIFEMSPADFVKAFATVEWLPKDSTRSR
jgi:Calpain family cysteine protease